MFASWVRAHGRAIRGYLLAMVRNAAVADELTQEVFCRAWQARQNYREQGNARAYLLRIADRLGCDWARAPKPPVQLDDQGWRQHEPAGRGAGPVQAAVLAEQAERLDGALAQLVPMQQRTLLLRYYGQMSFAEIAAMLDCPLNTVLSHCHRGLQALRQFFSDELT